MASPEAPENVCVCGSLPPVLYVLFFMDTIFSTEHHELILGAVDSELTTLTAIECQWSASCSFVSVVSPTVPETPGHNPQPRVCRGSDADHIVPRIIRRQAVGTAAFGSSQTVRVGLGAAGGIRI